jgi:transcriptional regulator with XRE-family HTH domain
MIQQARIEAGLTQEELGRAIGIYSHKAHKIWEYESGLVIPSKEVLSRIAEALSKPVSFFERDNMK